MKAILVIDMPDDLENHLDKVKIDVIGTLNGQELFHRLNQPLKPLPKPMPKDNSNEVNLGFELGWNNCLEEIEGETEWQE